MDLANQETREHYGQYCDYDRETFWQRRKDNRSYACLLYTSSLILTQADAMGFAPKWFGVDGMDGILTVEGFDTALAEGLMLLTPFSADAQDDLTKNFVTKYEKLYGEEPIQFAADAYDGVYIIKAALEKAGATPDMDASALCDALKLSLIHIYN